MPRISGERKLERLGEGTVFRSPSSSRRGLFHLTFVKDNGEVRCSCEGFCMHGHCWHLDSIPICLEKGHDPKFGRDVECHYVQDHKGDHSWGPRNVEQDSKPAQSTVEPFDPFKGLPQ